MVGVGVLGVFMGFEIWGRGGGGGGADSRRVGGDVGVDLVEGGERVVRDYIFFYFFVN